MKPLQTDKVMHLEHVHPSLEWFLGVSAALGVVRLYLHKQMKMACMKTVELVCSMACNGSCSMHEMMKHMQNNDRDVRRPNHGTECFDIRYFTYQKCCSSFTIKNVAAYFQHNSPNKLRWSS